MINKKILLSLCLSGFLFSSAAMATKSTSSFYAELSAGAGFPIYSTGAAELTGYPDSQYFANKTTTQAIIASSLGYQWALTNNKWFPSFRAGIEYSHGFGSEMSGGVENLGLVTDNYNYQVSRDTFMLLGKLNVVNFANGRLSPYALAGMGVSINQASDFTYSAKGNTPIVNPGYQNASNTAFAFALGAGLDYRLSDNIRLSAEYRYADYGAVKTGGGQGAFENVTMQRQLQDNEFLVSVRYLF